MTDESKRADEAKPLGCPFCGEAPALLEVKSSDDEEWWRIECRSFEDACAGTAIEGATRDWAIAVWNTRAAPTGATVSADGVEKGPGAKTTADEGRALEVPAPAPSAPAVVDGPMQKHRDAIRAAELFEDTLHNKPPNNLDVMAVCTTVAHLANTVDVLLYQLKTAEAKLAAAEQFKTYVHQRLDEMGIPHGDPENEHQKAGCRVGARLDMVQARLAAAAGDARDGWISVKDRVPERNTSVLYWCRGLATGEGYLAIADEWHDEDHLKFVKHWMPMPAAPAGDAVEGGNPK